MKILLIGEYYSENLGDPLLCRTVERIIQETYPEAEVVPYDISGKISYSANYVSNTVDKWQRMVYRVSYRFPFLKEKCLPIKAFSEDIERTCRSICLLNRLIRDHPEIELAVFAGGSLFMDYFAGVMYLVVRRLHKERIPVIFHACGMSTLSSQNAEYIQKMLDYSNVKSISLRDSYNRFIDTFKMKCEVQETYDTALLCSEYFFGKDEKTSEYGIGIIARQDCYDSQKNFIRDLLSSSLNWKMFVNGSKSDYLCAKKILADLGIAETNYSVYLDNPPETAEELIQTITGYSKIISYRMHSQITALSFGLPCFGFIWDDKVEELFGKIGFPDRSAKPGSIGYEKIFAILDDALCLNIIRTYGMHSKECLINSIQNALKK